MGTLGLFAGLGVVMIILAIAYYVLQVVAYWRIFTKGGEAGWKSLIPFYNYYVQIKMTWDTNFFWIFLVLAIIDAVISGHFGAIGTVVSVVSSIGVTVITIFSSYKLSKAFGHDVPFTIGLVLLNPIFLLILGLGSSQYQGKQ